MSGGGDFGGGGDFPSDQGGGNFSGGGDFPTGTLDKTRFANTSTQSNNFSVSDLSKDSALTEGWRKLAYQMQPSEGAGSGQLDPSSINNDAQWLRVFSLIVYKSGALAANTGNSPTHASSAAAAPQGARVVPFPRSRVATPRDTPSTTLDPVEVTAPANQPQQPQQDRGIDLSNLRCVFNINKTTNQSPNILYARVYNLSPTTLAKVLEFTRVQISAGYRYANYGLIFDGKVVQYRRGKETPVDTYLEIHAGDGDAAINGAMYWAVTHGGTKAADMIKNLQAAQKEYDKDLKEPAPIDPKLYPGYIRKTRVDFDHWKRLQYEFDNAYGTQAIIDNGQQIILSKGAYRTGEAVVLSPKTGLIGLPEVTPQGIQAKCLLNPRIQLGGLVKIDSAVLSGVAYTPGTAAQVDPNTGNIVAGAPTGGLTTGDLAVAIRGQKLETAWTSPIGLYKVLLMNINGDTRGNPWYNDLIMVALDSNGNLMRDANPSNAFRRASTAAINAPVR
jgi:hypothetical protein